MRMFEARKRRTIPSESDDYFKHPRSCFFLDCSILPPSSSMTRVGGTRKKRASAVIDDDREEEDSSVSLDSEPSNSSRLASHFHFGLNLHDILIHQS
jgi:hypothetical protein